MNHAPTIKAPIPGAAPPEPPAVTLQEREILSYLILCSGPEWVQVIHAKAQEVRAAWKDLIPDKERRDAKKELLAMEAKWHAFYHGKLQMGRGSIAELNSEIDRVNDLRGAADRFPLRADAIARLELPSYFEQLQAMHAKIARLEDEIRDLGARVGSEHASAE